MRIKGISQVKTVKADASLALFRNLRSDADGREPGRGQLVVRPFLARNEIRYKLLLNSLLENRLVVVCLWQASQRKSKLVVRAFRIFCATESIQWPEHTR